MNGLAIQAENLSYAYGELLAVDRVSFGVAPGEILGFLGPNGAGKSTTIKILTGQMPPRTGTVTILGLDAAREREAVQARIGVCFEEKNLYLNMSAAENLAFFARLYGIGDFDVRSALERVGLGDRATERVSQYSKGMRQRLMIARSLVNRPDVLFLDEPTEGLDPVSARAIRRIVTDEAARGAAVLLTTHDMHEADELSDRVAFINEGHIAALDKPESLKLQYGRRSVKVRYRADGGVRETTVPLGDADSAERLRALVGSPEVLTIHTEEASLEDIFVRVTGRGLT